MSRMESEDAAPMLSAIDALAPHGVVVVDREGRLLDLNASAMRMTGHSREELLGRPVTDFVPFEATARVREAIARTFLEGQAGPVDVPFRRQDGSLSLLVVEGRRLGEGCAAGYLEDVTERRRAEDELTETRALLLAAVNQTPAGILIADAPDVRIRHCNPAGLGIRGDSDTPLTEIPVELHPANWQTYYPDGRPVAPEDLPLSRAVLRGERSVNEEFIIRRSDGEDRWVLASAAPVRNQEGGIVAGIVVFPDITDRRRVEAALHASEERYRVISNHTGQLVYDWDVTTGRIGWAGRVEEITGYSLEELDGFGIAGWEERIHPADRARVSVALETAMRDLAAFHIDYRFQTRAGSYLLVEDSGVFLPDGSGRAARMLGSMKDITARRQLEDRLSHASRMEAIGRLAGGVAHDFNNLLTAILGHAGLALNGVAEDDHVHRHLEEIRKAGERAARLTRQLLAFSRKQIIEPKVLDLTELIRGTERMLERIIGEDIRLRTALQADLGPVCVDGGQIEQVIMNLAVNARDAMPGGGVLTLETSEVDLDPVAAGALGELPPGRYVRLTVSDTGQGMTEEVRARAFEPFFTTKAVDQGTGLGLASVLGIVQQHQGAIEVESAPGEGARFRAYFPRVREEVQPMGPGPESDELPTGHETILLAEDDGAVRDISERILRELGYQVLSAASGEAATACAAGHEGTIDLVVTDVIMPGMDGRELAARLTRARPGLKILFISGYTADVLAPHGVLEEGIQFLGKPYSQEELARKVREVLDGLRTL